MATWLGKDETHYVRIWNDKDIEDLKMLMQLTVYWISRELLTRKESRQNNMANFSGAWAGYGNSTRRESRRVSN